MSKAYCGIGNVPKNKKRGSMKECAEAGQIRYYGLKLIDEKLAYGAQGDRKALDAELKKVEKQRILASKKMVENHARGTRAKKILDYDTKLTDGSKKKLKQSDRNKLEKELNDLRKKQIEYNNAYKKIDALYQSLVKKNKKSHSKPIKTKKPDTKTKTTAKTKTKTKTKTKK